MFLDSTFNTSEAGTAAPPPLIVPPSSPEDCRRQAIAFRRAALLLATSDSPESNHLHRREAGRALVALAHLGGEADLRSVLSFEPPWHPVSATWTVACYQLGDLSPSDLRDFSGAAEAVRLLESCPIPAHLAAELLVSAPSGLRWTALVRTGRDVEFQPPGDPVAGSVHGGTGGVSGPGAGEAAAAWEDRLRAWSRDIETGLGAPPAVAPVGAAAPVVLLPAPPPAPAGGRLAPAGTDARLLSDIGSALGDLTKGVQLVRSGAATREAAAGIEARLDDLADQVADLAGQVDGLRRRLESLAARRPGSGPASRRWWRRPSRPV